MPEEGASGRLGVVEGYAFILGDNVDTDTIIPAKYLHITSPEQLAAHVFENTPEHRERLQRLQRPVVIVAGEGFGYGSSREHAVLALLAAGVKAVVAKSFHRIFYRNAINNGLLVVEYLEDPRPLLRDGAPVRINPYIGLLEFPGGRVRVRRLPGFIVELVERGGLRRELEELARAGSG